MRKPGFTFLELLIALSLFSIGMISVLRIFPSNRKYLTQSGQSTQAACLAQEEMEVVRGVNYSALTVMPTYYEAAHALGGTGDPLSAYTRKTEVVFIDPLSNWTTSNGNDTGMKKVKVTVSWAENGITRNYVLSSFVYDQ